MDFPDIYPRDSFVAAIMGIIEHDATCENVPYAGEEEPHG